MSFEGGIEYEDVEELIEETNEIEEPIFEEIFASDTSHITERRRTGKDRISPPFLGKISKARLIAARAHQLFLGAKPMIPIERLKSTELSKIALQELNERVLPIAVVRKFPDNTVEIWPISDFEYIDRD